MSGHGDPIPMTSRKGGPLRGEAHVPGDKSISHRSLMGNGLCMVSVLVGLVNRTT